MKKIYWIFTALVFVSGLGASLYFGLKPRPVPKIKLSYLVSPEEMGHAIIQRLRLEVQNQEVLFFGIDPEVPSHRGVLNGFLESIRGTPLEYQTLVVESELPNVEEVIQIFRKNVGLSKEGEVKSRTFTKMEIKSELPRLVEGLQKRNATERVLIIAPSIYATHTLPGNPMDILRQHYHLNLVSFTLANFPLSRDQEPTQNPPCVTDDDKTGTGPFGCLIQNQARLGYRKAKKEGKYTGQMDQVGQFEYLVLFTRDVFIKEEKN